MIAELGTIAVIQMGHSFRTRLDSTESGPIAVIQMKDLSDENIVDCSELTRIDMERVAGHHLVKPGDLVFRSRGQTLTSAILLDDPGNAVLAAPLLRIRIVDPRVTPQYLNWFISQQPAQAYFTSCAEGTAQKMISTQSLKSLKICIPPLERQRAIVEMAALAEAEQRIAGKLAEKRKQYISGFLIHMARGE